jgi:hypothetical protein
MTKKIAVLLLFFINFSFNLYAEEEFLFIADIGLINSKISNGLTPPSRLVIGIDIKKEAYYKLSYKRDIIGGGFFNKGLNIFNIEATDLFEKSGSFKYILDLKVGTLVLSKEIEINIQLDSFDDIKKTEDKIKNPEYEISLFIGDKLVTSSKKKLISSKLSYKVELPPMPDNYDAFYDLKRSDPALNSFSILDAVGAALGLVKKLITEKNKKKREIPIQKHKQITRTFLRKNSEGVAKEVKAVITLKIKELKISPDIKREIFPKGKPFIFSQFQACIN